MITKVPYFRRLFALGVLGLAWPSFAANPAMPVMPGVQAPQAMHPIVPPTNISVWEPDYLQLETPVRAEAENRFLEAARAFLHREGVDTDSIQVQLAPLGDPSQRPAGSWRALAEVYVDHNVDGSFTKRLVFEPAFWMSNDSSRFAHHRWAKILWHEMHHLDQFPRNLQRAPELARQFPPMRTDDLSSWEKTWITFLEPLEEMNAEHTCIQRYVSAFGPLSDELLRDSRGDMRKYSALYRERLVALLQKAKDPHAILEQFPSELPIDTEGNIL
jgi:hypothetical protein